MYIPQLGDIIELSKDWKFKLYHESRNSGLHKVVNDKYEFSYKKYNVNDTVDIILECGTQLKIDRIYIRKGLSDFDSISFIIENHKDINYKGKRFWVKLNDANEIEFNKKLEKKNIKLVFDEKHEHKDLTSLLYETNKNVDFKSNNSYYAVQYYDNTYLFNNYEIINLQCLSRFFYRNSIIKYNDEHRFDIINVVDKLNIKDADDNVLQRIKNSILDSYENKWLKFNKKLIFYDYVIGSKYKLVDLKTNKEYFSKNYNSLKQKAKSIIKEELKSE